MSLADDIAEIGGLIDAYDAGRPACHVVVNEDGEARPPLDMRVEGSGEDDWVTCRVLPSTLHESAVAGVENEYGVSFPPMFRAYLLARFHMHDQLRSGRHQNQVLWPALPSRDTLEPLEVEMRAWSRLIQAGYIPIAEWGDGWGPVCLDTAQRDRDGECPVVWMDHELLLRVGVERISDRAAVLPLAQPLYDSSRELIRDLFTIPAASQ